MNAPARRNTMGGARRRNRKNRRNANATLGGNRKNRRNNLSMGGNRKNRKNRRTHKNRRN